MKLVKKIVLWAAGFFLLFSIAGFFVAPPVLKSVLLKKLSESLHREVSVGKIKVNPYLLSISISNVRIKDVKKQETFVSFEELYIDASISSVFSRAAIVNELKIRNPYILIVRNEDGTYNFSDLLVTRKVVREETEAPKTKKKSEPFHFSVNNIIINGGRIEFIDKPKGVRHSVMDVNVGIPFISNVKYHVNTYVQPSFSAKINGAVYALQGKAKPFAVPREAHIDINIKNIGIAHYMAYIPVELNFILQSGTLDIASRVSFVQHEDKTPSLVISGDVALKDIVIDDMKKQNILRLPSFNIVVASLEPFLKSLRLSSVVVGKPELNIRRNREGVLNVAGLVKEKGPIQEAALKGASEVKKKRAAKPPPNKDKDEAFRASVDEFLIERGKCVFYDRAASHPLELIASDVNLTGEGFTTEKNKSGKLSLEMVLNKKGVISVKGPVTANPLTAVLDVNLKSIDIRHFQQYFTDRVKINVTSGNINAAGRLAVVSKDKGGISITYNGDALFSDFASVDKLYGEDFLKWKAFSVKGVEAGYGPVYAHIKGLSLADFYARVTLNEDGTLSLRKIIEDETPAVTGQSAEEQKKAEEPETNPTKTESETAKNLDRDFSVGSITLQGGTIDFMDRMIKPSYSVNLTEMTGRIGGFSLNLDKRADVELRGRIDNHVPLEIAGKINPARNNLFTDISVGFKDLDLSAMTPYSGKYMGYKIEKGSLSIDLKYLIDKRKLDSENRIFIDQLTLGDKVESPDATKLPLKLAIALLKDRNGRIELDVPVSGSLDDPKFSVFRIVIKVIVNLVVKAATAPFALLGALFGGGEELSYVEFDYGKEQLSPAASKKIDMLAKALYERPSLKLDIEGHADVDSDKEALKKDKFNRKVKTQKLNDMISKGIPAVPVDDVVVEKQEYQKYLTTAYKKEKFEKPRNMLGIAKGLPVPEMEKLMYVNTLVDDGDLRALAKQRASRVKDALLATGKVTTDRIFIVEPKSISPEKKEKLSSSRVDLRLK